MNKNIIIIMVIGIFLISINCYASSSIKVYSLSVNNKTEELDINLKIPQISGLNNKDAERKYNNIFLNEITNFAFSITNESISYIKDALKNNRPVHQFVGDVSYKVYNNDRILSIVISYYRYTGGAHGMSTLISYNIDKKTGNNLTFNRFLSLINLTEKEVNKIIKNKIKKSSDLYFSGEMGFKSVSKKQEYYINGKDLVVYFPLYEIACYASGIPEFSIPFLYKK